MLNIFPEIMLVILLIFHWNNASKMKKTEEEWTMLNEMKRKTYFGIKQLTVVTLKFQIREI